MWKRKVICSIRKLGFRNDLIKTQSRDEDERANLNHDIKGHGQNQISNHGG